MNYPIPLNTIWKRAGKLINRYNNGEGRIGSLYPDEDGVEFVIYDEHNLYVAEGYVDWDQLKSLLDGSET